MAMRQLGLHFAHNRHLIVIAREAGRGRLFATPAVGNDDQWRRVILMVRGANDTRDALRIGAVLHRNAHLGHLRFQRDFERAV